MKTKKDLETEIEGVSSDVAFQSWRINGVQDTLTKHTMRMLFIVLGFSILFLWLYSDTNNRLTELESISTASPSGDGNGDCLDYVSISHPDEVPENFKENVINPNQMYIYKRYASGGYGYIPTGIYLECVENKTVSLGNYTSCWLVDINRDVVMERNNGRINILINTSEHYTEPYTDDRYLLCFNADDGLNMSIRGSEQVPVKLTECAKEMLVREV